MDKNNTTYLPESEIKEMIIEIGKRMYDRRYVAGNDGNISIKCSDNEIWITPTGVSKGFMKTEDLIKMDLDGNVIEGKNKASSEYKMHLKVYEKNKDVTAVVHAHPLNCTVCSIIGLPLDSPTLVEAIIQIGTIPVAPFAIPGTNEMPDSIAPFCNDYKGVLLSNHGALAWGKTPLQAYYRLETMEFCANVLLELRKNGLCRSLSKDQIQQLKERFTKKLDMKVIPQGVEVPENITPIIEDRK